MSKRMQTSKVPACEVTSLSAIICDLCGKEHRVCGGDREADWDDDTYEVAKVIVSIETGAHYPECHHTETKQLHICPLCFEKKVLPWFKSQGAEPTVTEEDY